MPAHSDQLEQLDRRRGAFAAEVLELTAVLELFERSASSSLGKRVLRELAPRDDGEARAALARVREMQLLFKLGDLPGLAGVTDPLPPGAALTRALDEQRFVALRGFLDAAERLSAWFAERVLDVPELAAVAARIPDLEELKHAIDRVLDERGKVRHDASDLLARLRRLVAEMNDRVDRALKDVMQRGDVRAVLSDGSVHRRGGRPVLAVKARMSGRVRGIVHDRSQSGESVFVEPQEVIELGNRLAEALSDERREVERVLLELTRHVQARASSIHAAAREVGELELAVIAARYCAAHDARPALVPGEPEASAALLLRRARHPLLIEQALKGELDAVVPIDVRLGADFDMLIVTGPNTGGKTLALKTAGLFALMTRCGLPVPAAEGTTVPLYEAIAADIGDEQEISQNLSTFASHLVRIKAGLASATPRTLVLLDELGGGTDPDEGAALGEAVLETLLALRAPTLVSTHISRLKEFAFRHARAENACTEFDLESLSPLYQLHVGMPGESGALVIARRLGLPESVVALAEERTRRREGEVVELMADVRVARLQAERLRASAEDRLEDARARQREVEERGVELDRRSNQLEAEAQRGLEERLRDSVRQLERARALLPQVGKDAAAALTQVLDALAADLTGASLTDRRQAFLESLGKGSMVYLPRYRQRVLVHKVDKERREVVCKLGAMRVRVSYEEVTPYESL